MTQTRAYLDWNASAPLLPQARTAMLAVLDEVGNPSSVHAEGRRARAIVEAAREQVAALVNAKPSEVVFTSGATESNTAAIGAGWDEIARPGTEHESVLVSADASGAAIIELPINAHGEVTADASVLKAPTRAGRSLLSLQLANNETGVVQSVGPMASAARAIGWATHCDAVQGAGRMPIDFRATGVDLLSLSAHKLGGPKGVGALIVRDGFALPALVVGGGQEHRRRAGTENIVGIAGFGAAADAVRLDDGATGRMQDLRDRLEAGILDATPDVRIIGRGARERLVNTSSIAWPGALAETLVIALDLAGFAVSAGAACSSGKVGRSRVLAAMGLDDLWARSAIRVSLGPTTGTQEITAFLDAWRTIAARRTEQRQVA